MACSRRLRFEIFRFNPEQPESLFFATDGGVFASFDGGETFEGRNGGYQTSQFYNGFSSAEYDPDLAIGGLQDNWSNLYEGTVAWRRKLIGGDGCWTAINPQDDDTIYGTAQWLYLVRSRDGGENWSDITPPEQGGDVTAFVAPFMLSESDPDVLYAGRSRVYKSGDEGSNWLTTNGGQPLDGSNPTLSMAVSATDPDIVYVGTAPMSSRARIFRTGNGGASWDVADDLMINLLG